MQNSLNTELHSYTNPNKKHKRAYMQNKIIELKETLHWGRPVTASITQSITLASTMITTIIT